MFNAVNMALPGFSFARWKRNWLKLPFSGFFWVRQNYQA
jgi:hypothetical protein